MDVSADSIELAGEVVSVIYRSDETGYTVLKMETGGGESVTVVGCLPFTAPGEQISASGSWLEHPKHGRQFSAEYAKRRAPEGADAIFEYLSSGAVKGVGPATALLLVQKFGNKTLDVLENEPERLAEIKGLSLKRAKEISENCKKQAGIRRLMEFLQNNGLKPALAMRLYRIYGDDSLEALRHNPYIIAGERVGADFSEADNLALGLGFEPDCIERIEAALCFELRHNAKNGHCFIPGDKLVAATAQLLESPPEPVDEALGLLCETGEIVAEEIAGITGCYLKRMYLAERTAADRLSAMAADGRRLKIDVDKLLDTLEKEISITYEKHQRETIALAAERRLLVITGGPGTGKTTCLRAIDTVLEKAGIRTVLTAPTGRAAKRMSEITGREAQTVHRLLEAGYNAQTDETVFKRSAADPLDCGAVILDECSMVDIILFAALLDAMPGNCRLIMVGDADQLPSVGPGNVFSDVIRSGAAEVVRLTEIFRQTGASRIVENAHMINRGEHPRFRENGGDFFFMKRAEQTKAAETIAELCTKRLPDNMGIPARDIQVLSPTRRSEAGTRSLNTRLQAALNPPGKGKKERKFGETTFREGDKVMQIRNNYDIIWEKTSTGESGAGIFNGDVGFITRVDEDAGVIYVEFDDRVCAYGADMPSELEHAFAMTVHKSQGSEYRAVVLSATRGPAPLLSRGILYTAVTRARELLVIVGDDDVLDTMIDNYRQVRRYSGLRARLAGQVADNG